ncbi:MAG TPA: hypothetical protein PLK29_06910 [Chiayiivirga sp.]|nr:hypothetical protein [Chiayiivirga sp.]
MQSVFAPVPAPLERRGPADAGRMSVASAVATALHSRVQQGSLFAAPESASSAPVEAKPVEAKPTAEGAAIRGSEEAAPTPESADDASSAQPPSAVEEAPQVRPDA